MPTGYTAIIEEKPDLTFREFALRCARAMGACVMQRDDPMDELPRVPPPSDYHEKSLEVNRARLAKLRGLSEEGADALFAAERESVEKANAESVAKCRKVGAAYAKMRAQVVAWSPPTRDHEGLREFMLEQIDACSSDWTPYTRTSEATPAEWLARQIDATEWSVAYGEKHIAEELARYEERKAWIESLYASLEAQNAMTPRAEAAGRGGRR